MDQQQLFVQMALQSWTTQIARAEKVFNSYSDTEFYSPVAPGKNRIIYLYGHLAAYHDALKETLGLGKRDRPELFATFLQIRTTPKVHIHPWPNLKPIGKLFMVN